MAARAGTSTAVVSYVLNNGPRPVSDTLRAKVVAAVEELNYRPDRVARALRRPRRWRQIGLLVPDLAMPLYGAFVGRVEVEARARGHLTMIGNTRFDPDREVEFTSSFADVGIDGLIVVSAVNAAATSRICAQERVPVVWVHNSRGAIDSPIVGADHVRAGRLATQHLIDTHGCVDILFVGGLSGDDVEYGDRETVTQRFLGFSAMLGESARTIRTDLSAAGSYAAVSAYLRTHARPPRGMVIGTYGQSAAVLRAVVDAGLHTPDDIRLVGFDADTTNNYRPITLTTVQQPIEAITRRALSHLLDEDPVEAESPDVTLNLGETCGCAPRTNTAADLPNR
ncbi:MAG: LacI family DNA-binding transcriptional regulator, partial [Mycobacterium sp.]|nr:LacI family DNA-binding transcriptional regulator [Mycobacterium sp.]